MRVRQKSKCRDKDFINIMTATRNRLKHADAREIGERSMVTPECTQEIIDRVVDNLSALGVAATTQVSRYLFARASVRS